MPRTPAKFTQADVARIIRAARQAGASEVAVPIGNGPPVIVRLTPSTAPQESVADDKEIVL